MIDTKASFDREAAGAAKHARALFFISDLHLSEAIPQTVAAFEYFIEVTANEADSVFILGDLFEFWIGDDILDAPATDPRAAFARRMARVMHTLSERGIGLYVMHGNRDFLLGPRFMKDVGAMLLPDPFVITAFGKHLVFAHGDGLCTADRMYQHFRAVARSRFAQRLFLGLPLNTRLGIGQRMRAKSEGARMTRTSAKYDVTKKAVSELFIGSRTHTLIHGHTHRPAMHREVEGVRWVLPDWELDTAPPRGGYLRLDENGLCAQPL
ncbi:MAG: UDP-2,3-diacylglucosamine diphosphatase (EC [uncultured Caballeronia sp.]|nr:MAG: UDP-2,3-diacylglucosamine diphosphatase (EC [uncultured Caballeronia sp.]